MKMKEIGPRPWIRQWVGYLLNSFIIFSRIIPEIIFIGDERETVLHQANQDYQSNQSRLLTVIIRTKSSFTGVIQIKVLTTLPVKFQGVYEKIENLNCTIEKNINFVFFRKFVAALVQKLKTKCK